MLYGAGIITNIEPPKPTSHVWACGVSGVLHLMLERIILLLRSCFTCKTLWQALAHLDKPATESHLACCSSSISCRHSWVKCGPTSGGTAARPWSPRTHNYCQPRLMNTVNLPGRTSECLQKCLRLWASLGTTSRKDLPDTWYMLSFHISKFGLYSSRMWIFWSLAAPFLPVICLEVISIQSISGHTNIILLVLVFFVLFHYIGVCLKVGCPKKSSGLSWSSP